MKKVILFGLAVAGSGFASARAADARADWQTHCAACHGRDGTGHTRAGRMLRVKNLADPANQKAFSDSQAFNDVKNGLKDSDGNNRMKPFAGKLTDDQIRSLVTYVRTLAK